MSAMNRRDFLKTAAVCGTIPYFFSSAARGDVGLDRLRLGVIGCGGQGRLDLEYFDQLLDTVVLCDVDSDYGLAKTLATGLGIHRGETVTPPETCADYRRVLDRDDVDAVLIATPDHWHTKIAVEALAAGKHVFCEKPLTLTLEENLIIRKAAAKYDKVFEVGTMQRCFKDEFMLAALIVRGGHLGTIKRMTVDVGGGEVSPAIPTAAAPATLDWNQWLGQAPAVEYRASDEMGNAWDASRPGIAPCSRGHYRFRWWYEYSGGKFTDWGAHHIDVALWCTNRQTPGTGPVTIDGTDSEHPVEFKDGYPVLDDRYNTANRFNVLHTFADGSVMNVCSNSPDGNGVLFEGTKGKMHVSRGRCKGKIIEEGIAAEFTEDDYAALNNGQPLEPNPDNRTNQDRAFYVHKENFINCIRTGAKPISDVASHVQTAYLCHLSAIAARLKRKINWDSLNEKITGDEQAASFFSRTPRKGFEIPEV